MARRPEYTHLYARSRRPSFRRAGLQFTSNYSLTPLDMLTSAQLKAIEAQSDEIESRRITADEAAELGAVPIAREQGDDETPSQAELRQQLDNARARVAQLQAENDELRRALTGDRPPKAGHPLPGAIPPLPTPGAPPLPAHPSVKTQSG